MPLRHEVSEAGFNVKTSEVELVEPVVVKQLFADIDQSVQVWRNPRLVESSRRRRHHKIALLIIPGERDIRCPIKRHASRDGKRLILLHPFEDLLLAEI